MNVYNVQQLYFWGVLCAFGSVLTQTDIHMVCPSEIWEPGANITLQCFVQKLSYPAHCVTSDGKKVTFNRRRKNERKSTPVCTVTDIPDSCKSSGDCRCGTENSSHYLFEYEFTATTNKEGYWDCFVECYDRFTPLVAREDDCENRKVNDNPDRLKKELIDLRKKCKVDTESSSPSNRVIGLVVAGAVCVVMAVIGAGVFCRKRGSGGHQNAPPDNIPPDNAPQNNAPPNNAPPNNGPPFNGPPFNSPPDNGPQVAGQAGPSTGGFPSTYDAEFDDSSADGSEATEATEASEVSEGSKFTASEVGDF